MSRRQEYLIGAVVLFVIAALGLLAGVLLTES